MEYYEIVNALNKLSLEERETIAKRQLEEVEKERSRMIRAKIESHIKAIRENIDALLDMDFDVRFETETSYLNICPCVKNEYIIDTF